MKICKVLLVIGLAAIATSQIAQAQSKVDYALNTAEGAAETVNKAGKTLKTISSLFKKKDKKAAENITEIATSIQISGVRSYEDANKFKDAIVSCKSVKSANLKFRKDRSTIQVAHDGSTEDFLEDLRKTGTLAGKNIASLEEGFIEIEVPQQ